MILQIKRGNRVIAESADFSYSPSLQEVRKLTCEVVSVVPIEFKAYNSRSESEYDTVVYNGNTFILYQAPSGDNLNEAGKYKYSLLFYGKEVLLQNVAFLDIVSGTGGEINKIRYTHGGLFQFWGDAKQLAARIEANIESYNASLGVGYTGIGTWTLNVDAEGELTEDMIDITDGTNLFEALKNFYDKFYLNYYFSTTANGGIITITDKTRPSVNWTFKQGDGGGAVKVSSSVDTSTPVITRIIPQGGSRNVPPEYKKDAKPADESRYCPYILLPNDSDGNIRYYIDSEYGLKNYGVRGKTISNTFSGIYPSIRGKKLGDLYPSGLPEWDTYKADGEPDPQSGKVAGEGASASTRIDKIIGSTPIKSDDSDSFFIYMTSPGFNLGYKVYEDGDSSDKINDNVQPQYKPHAMFDKYRDFESFDIYGTRAYYDQPVKVTATFSGKMLFSVLPIGSDAVGKKVKINLRMVLNRVLGQASPLKEVVIGEEGATGMLEIPYDKTALVGYIEKGQNTTVTIRIEFTFDSDVPAGSCKIGFSEEMTCNIHFGNQDGSQDRFYYKYASVTDAVFSMRTGTYTGTEFKINKNGIIPLYGEVNGDTGETEEDVAMFNKGARYKISCYRTDSDNAKLPLYTDGKSPSIAEGTEFVILNIVMPESYVTMAENTLEKAALDYLSRYDHENRTVSLDISSGFVAEHPNLFIDFIEGNMLKVRDDGIGVFDFSDNGQIVDMQLQIQSLEIKYSKDNMFPSYSCTIARRKILSFYERLAQENQTASTQNTTNVTLGGSGTGSGTNIFSEQLLNDLIASFQKFNGWFEWDEANQALRCKSAFYTNQWISALGAQSGSGEPGGGEGGLIKAVYGFADLGKTFDDSNLSNTFNAYTINEIWKLAKEGGMNTDKLWQELGKDDPTKKIHISHIPDNKFVTLDTEQTVTASKIFTGQLSTANIVPSVNNASTLGLDTKRWENIYSVNGTFSQNVTAKLLSASETLQIGDAYLKWDSTNNAVYVIKKDGTTPVGFYSTDWLSAKGVSMSGVQTGTLADLTDVEITNPTNGQALKYDAISQKWVNGTIDSFNVNQMWTELTKADSSKVIDASHIPTSVLDNRWVKKAGDTMTGTLTSASTTGSIIFKGLENCDITNIYTNNGTLYSDTNLAIRNGLRFNWYDTYWYIGNLRGAGTNSSGFGIANESNKLCLQVTPDYTTAPVFRSSASQGTAPLIVNSTTQVSNLNADLLDGYHAFGTSNALIKYGYTVSGTEPAWCRIATYSIRNTGTMTDVCFVLHSAFDDLFGLLVVRTRGTSYVQGELMVAYNINTSNIRIYHDAEKRNIELYCHGGNAYSVIQANLLYSHDRYGEANTNITLYRGDTKAPSWSTYVNPGFVNLQNSSDVAKKLQTPRTLWGQSFDGTANVSGNMTGVGSITMSGNLEIGNGTSPNAILFYGTTGDSPGGYNHTFIAERLWGGTECSELVLFKGNDLGNGTDAITVSNSGPDRIRHIAAAHLFQTYTTVLSGSVESVCTSSALKNLFSIASNRVISYVQLQSTIASGVAPFIVASNTVVSNLNADLLDGQHLSDLDGRYVNVTGDTMTGDLIMNNTKGFNIGWSTRVAKNSGVWIHGGADAASSTDANLRFASWYGIGWYPTIDTASGVRLGNNAMWLNVRTGVLNVVGGIKESTICIGRVNSSGDYDTAYNGEINRYDHHLFLQHHSGKYLIMCTGGGLAGIGTNSPGEKLHVAGNTRTDGYFRSTVGTGTQPYQCSSTTLNTNLNADLLDNWHIMDIPRNYNSTATYSLQFALGGTDNGWKKIFACSESGAGPYRSVTVWGRIWYAYGNHAQEEVRYYHFCAIFQMRSAPSASDSNVGNVSNSARLYLPTFAKGMDNIRLVRVGTNNFELQVRQIGSYNNGYIQYQYWANGANVSAWRGLQSTSNTSVAVSAGDASTLADSRASSADVWTTARTFYIQDHNASHTGAGVSVNGSANVYLKLPNSIQCGDWFRSTGHSGWYHQDYGGGIYMEDSNFIRNFGSKRLRIQTDTYDTLRLVRTSGSGGSSIAFYNGGGTFRGQFGMNATSWFTFDTGTATNNQSVVEISPAGGIHSKAEITAKASGSDIRLKKDIQNYNAMDIINKFRSVKYHWNDVAKANSEVYNNDYDQFGLIAQDLIAGGFKQWVRDVFHDYYTVTYERLIPVVWKGLQEVDDEVTRLKKRVRELENRLGIYNQ